MADLIENVEETTVPTTLEDMIIADLKIELESDPNFKSNILSLKVKSAIRELKTRRNYIVTNLTEEEINADLENYYSVIMNVARYDYNQIGAEGEKTHNENGVNRTFVDRDSLFTSVFPFVKVV